MYWAEAVCFINNVATSVRMNVTGNCQVYWRDCVLEGSNAGYFGLRVLQVEYSMSSQLIMLSTSSDL